MITITQIEISYTIFYKNGSTESNITVEDVDSDNLKEELYSFKERMMDKDIRKVSVNSWNNSVGYKIN